MSDHRCHGLDVLSPYLDGELSREETRAVRRHVESCERCSRELARLERLEGLVFEAALTSRRPRWVPLGFAAAAAGLLLAVWLALPDRAEPTPAPAPTADPAPTVSRPSALERIDALIRAETAGTRRNDRRPPGMSPAARRLMRERLGEGDPAVVRAALALIGETRDRAAVEPTVALLDRADVVADAARALAAIGDESAAPALAAAFRTGAASDAAADALVELRAVEELDDLMSESFDPDRRSILIHASGRLPAALAAPLLARHLDSALAGDVLRAARDEVIPVLRRRLRSGDRTAAVALGVLEDEISLPAFARLLEDPSTRAAGARALAALDTDEAIAILFAAAGDRLEDPVVLALAGADAARVLADRFENGSHDERRRAIRLAGLCGAASAAELLEDALENPALAATAVTALGRFGLRHPEAVGLLARAGRVAALRTRAIHALGETGRAEAVPALRSLAVDMATTRAAAASLGRIPHDDAIRALLALMDRPRHEVAARRALRRYPADRVARLRAGREKDEPPLRPRVRPEI